MQLPETLFSAMKTEEMQLLVDDLEDELFKKNPDADIYYQKRIKDVCDNVRFLKDFKDIQELMVVKKKYSFGKLL